MYVVYKQILACIELDSFIDINIYVFILDTKFTFVCFYSSDTCYSTDDGNAVVVDVNDPVHHYMCPMACTWINEEKKQAAMAARLARSLPTVQRALDPASVDAL